MTTEKLSLIVVWTVLIAAFVVIVVTNPALAILLALAFAALVFTK